MAREEDVKGRIAEAIVRCMFEDLGFEVVSYGYEHTCPSLANKNKTIDGEVKSLIRKAPDFVVVDKKGQAYFIEVKFRADGRFKREADYPFRDCYILLLTKDYMGIEQYKNLDDETTLTSANFMSMTKGSFKSLIGVPLFSNLDKVDKDIILEYRDLLKKYLKEC